MVNGGKPKKVDGRLLMVDGGTARIRPNQGESNQIKPRQNASEDDDEDEDENDFL
jgi:hypothetical protein